MAKKQLTPSTPETEAEADPRLNGKGRESSLPSALTGNQQRGQQHHTPSQDHQVSLEDYNAILEILKPGVTRDELDVRTDINVLQQVHISRGRVIAKRFGIRYLDTYIDSHLRLALSLKRKSRKEHVAAIQGIKQEDSAVNSILSKLGG